ncbi:sugar transferase [Thermovibrio sp.]
MEDRKNPYWKRIFDIVFSLFVIGITSPLLVLIALVIKFTDGGSILFRQKRPGLNGKEFVLYKFRTMYPNNEEILEEYLRKNPKAREEWRIYRKLKTYDPRVTPVGRFLRKYSLDELPQFFNVLKGDMSVVGPRPYIYKELEEYKVSNKVREKLFSVKPGITGLWQVKARNEATFEDRIKLDLEYVDEMSFWLDLKIIIKTIWMMLTGKGAY